jgi:hypothetical protein
MDKDLQEINPFKIFKIPIRVIPSDSGSKLFCRGLVDDPSLIRNTMKQPDQLTLFKVVGDHFFSPCLISSVNKMSFALAMRAKSLFIVHPIDRIKGFIEKVTLSFEPIPSIEMHEMFYPG